MLACLLSRLLFLASSLYAFTVNTHAHYASTYSIPYMSICFGMTAPPISTRKFDLTYQQVCSWGAFGCDNQETVWAIHGFVDQLLLIRDDSATHLNKMLELISEKLPSRQLASARCAKRLRQSEGLRKRNNNKNSK